MNQLKEANNNTKIIGLIIAIIVMSSTCFIFPFIGFFADDSGGSFASIMTILIIAGSACIPVVILGAIFIYPALQGMFVSKPVIAIYPPQARVGEQVKMTYQQTFKKNLEIEKLSFQLVLRETAKYRRGTDTYTVKHEHPLDEFGYSARTVRKGEVISDEWQLQIPSYGVPTFKANNNRLEYYVKVHIDAKGWFNFKREYEIPVLPERINI